jgi:riboflavin kinase/FMN adenylyltransferase
MEVFRRLPPPDQRRACALTIGNFDGVHRGHRAVIETLTARARARGLATCVLTFEPHPREYFAKRSGDPSRAPAHIQTTRDKLNALAECGVDRVCVAPFDARLANLSARDFFENIIVEGLDARDLLVGDDFRFGHQRQGDFATLSALCAERGLGCSRIESFEVDGMRVSSSAVREALATGNFDRARHLLGRAFTLTGHVLHGRKLGRTIGFPTLNLRIPFERPALAGIFVVRVHGLRGHPLPGVASLGTRPAVEANGRLLLEVHLFDFSEEVYGQVVSVEFMSRLREERHYDSLELLTEQIARDADQARAWHAAHPFQAASLSRD